MSLSTHVLDAARGLPAESVSLRLIRRSGGELGTICTGRTDSDGRFRLVEDSTNQQLSAGTYELRFETGDYFTATGQTGFYPEVTIAFEITDPSAHHHVPLLLSPFAFSTYKGS